jgi:hypothetical protein
LSLVFTLSLDRERVGEWVEQLNQLPSATPSSAESSGVLGENVL